MKHKLDANYFLVASRYHKLGRYVECLAVIMQLLSIVFQNELYSLISACGILLILPAIRCRRIKYQNLADGNRRKEFLDNSFATKLMRNSKTGYYDNDGLSIGLYKTFVNLFENCFFSFNITSKMVSKQKIKYVSYVMLSFLIIVAGIVVGEYVTVLSAVFCGLIFVGEWLLFRTYVTKVSVIYDKINDVFKEGLTRDDFHERKLEGIAIHFLIEYEINIAQNNIMLDSKIFNEMNEELTLQWEEMKKKYQITG